VAQTLLPVSFDLKFSKFSRSASALACDFGQDLKTMWSADALACIGGLTKYQILSTEFLEEMSEAEAQG
jgi:hypothetical protein